MIADIHPDLIKIFSVAFPPGTVIQIDMAVIYGMGIILGGMDSGIYNRSEATRLFNLLKDFAEEHDAPEDIIHLMISDFTRAYARIVSREATPSLNNLGIMFQVPFLKIGDRRMVGREIWVLDWIEPEEFETHLLWRRPSGEIVEETLPNRSMVELI